jgi:hypothetical protein
MHTVIRLVVTYIGLSVASGLGWIILSYPDTPSTTAQWLWLFALALPVQLAGEFVGELLWNNKASRLVEQKTAAKSFSLLRICYGLVLLLLFAGLLLGVGFGWRVLRPLLGMQ